MKIALTGSMMSGKTTLARYLAQHHGFYVMNYTDSLKQIAVEMLQSAGLDISLETFLADKKRYRPFLQELGTAVGFDQGYGVERCLNDWLEADCPEHVVFDNVRFVSQFQKLLPFGFVLVGLSLGEEDITRRARATGMSPNELQQVRAHHAEQQPRPDVFVNANRPVEQISEVLLRLGGIPCDFLM